MLRVGLEPTIPAFERVNTVHTLDRAATVIGCQLNTYMIGVYRLQNFCAQMWKLFCFNNMISQDRSSSSLS
jgi:hypothetical protein